MPTEDLSWTTPDNSDGTPEWANVRVDSSVPSVARTYDYLLWGKDNFAVDRKVAEAMFVTLPDTRQTAVENRAWISRVVRYMVGEAGIRQIIDIGSGLPTSSNVHNFAQELAPETRVAYVDKDPVVLAHGRAILAENDRTTVVTADVTDLDSIFENPELRELIDPSRPVGIVLACVLHHVPSPHDQRVAAELRERLSPGSYLAIDNFCDPGDPRAAATERALMEAGLGSGWFRPYPQHRMYFGGLELVAPGLGPINEWRPESDIQEESSTHHLLVGGVGYRP